MTHLSGHDRSQLLLLPEAVDDYVGPDNPVRFIDVLLHLVENGPGRTETELAQAIFGHKGYRQQVNSDCVRLARSGGEIERRGSGGHADPHRYYPIHEPV